MITDPKIANEVLQRLDILAMKLGVASNHIYAALLKQAYIDSICFLAWYIFNIVIIIVLSSIAFKNLSKEIEKSKRGLHEEENKYMFPFALTAAFCLVFFLTISNMSNVLAGFYNPDYVAFKKIISILKHN